MTSHLYVERLLRRGSEPARQIEEMFSTGTLDSLDSHGGATMSVEGWVSFEDRMMALSIIRLAELSHFMLEDSHLLIIPQDDFWSLRLSSIRFQRPDIFDAPMMDLSGDRPLHSNAWPLTEESLRHLDDLLITDLGVFNAGRMDHDRFHFKADRYDESYFHAVMRAEIGVRRVLAANRLSLADGFFYVPGGDADA